ncbi:MAG: hypothetical protein O7C56_03260, partial [Rickettsia endosymbiont of Ixodes persulcatus]|nr:hypothetical protein [Rickettsia endosymbiont of Ixodes persulcatus]
KLGRHPTESNYLNAFMLPPISIDHRQSTLIDTWFRARNSTSHFNTGITSKSVCDLMLTGLTSMYNDYFLPSKAYRLENQQH